MKCKKSDCNKNAFKTNNLLYLINAFSPIFSLPFSFVCPLSFCHCTIKIYPLMIY